MSPQRHHDSGSAQPHDRARSRDSRKPKGRKEKDKSVSKAKERRKEREHDELMERALATVRRSAQAQELSTADIVEMAKALKKRSRHDGEHAAESGSDDVSAGRQKSRKRKKKSKSGKSGKSPKRRRHEGSVSEDD